MDGYRVQKVLENLGVRDGNRILVALSGGLDSVCLLHILKNCNLNLTCHAAHVNFHLRNEESNQDESFVKELSNTFGTPLHIKQADTYSFAKENSLSIEMAARNIRYDWFNQLIQEHNYDFLAVAHHADDNAETLILNLTRGTGLKGLAAIPQVNGKIIRPLLDFTRKDIEKYAIYHKLSYRIDSTNALNDFSRNRIRNQVIPELKKINPSLIKTFNRNISLFTMASNILEELLPQILEIVSCKESIENPKIEFERLSIKELVGIKEWQYWLYLILQQYNFNSSHCQDTAHFLESDYNGVKRIISETHLLIMERGFLKIYSAIVLETIPDIIIKDIGEYLFGDFKISIEIVDNSADLMHNLKDNNDALYLDWDKIEFPILLRGFVSGDKFTPFGMRGVKKISDLFTDVKIDNVNRARTPILTTVSPSSNIICIPGLRIDSKYRVTNSTSKVLVIRRGLV